MRCHASGASCLISGIVLFAVVAALVTGCAAAGDRGEREGNESASRALVGGDGAQPSQFPSTIDLISATSMCTAAKIGDRAFLTAAHCVTNAFGVVRPDYAPGAPISISNDVVIDGATDPTELTVDTAIAYPDWATACASGECGTTAVVAGVPADVALVFVNEETSDVPVARVDMRSVVEGDGVVVMGYGCEQGLSGPAPAPRRLKFASTNVLAATALDHDGSQTKPSDPLFQDVVDTYFLTPGAAMNGGVASLCPGDSGGPVYRDDGAATTIVGINANYSFEPGSDIAYTNWHTRLDDASREHVGLWLELLGAKVTSTSDASAPSASDPCGALSFAGRCDGDTVVWCDGTPQSLDCAAGGESCGWNDAAGYFDCLQP